MTADNSCRGPSKRLHIKWVLDNEDLRFLEGRLFGDIIQDRYRQISENGKLRYFYPLVLFYNKILRDSRDIAIISYD